MNKYALRVTTLLVSAALAQQAYASGFQFSSQSASNQATANASTAEAADASTISYNPAGLMYLEGTQFSGTLNIVSPSIKAKNQQATTLNGNPIAGSTDDSIGDMAVAPHMYASKRVNERMALGLGVYVPFGSGTDYKRDSVLRYNINQTKLEVIAFNPTVAFKLTPKVSVGMGLVAQYAHAELRQSANFAAALARVYSLQATAAGGAATPQGQTLLAAAGAALAQDGKGPLDGFAEVKGNDWGFGFNFGALWDVTDSTRVGFNYRSKVKHELTGDADWTMPASDPAVFPNATSIIENTLGYIDSAAKVKVSTPASYSFHIMHQLNPQTRLYADVSRTNHSSFTQADVEYAAPKRTINPNQTTNFTRLNSNWKNTTKIAVGASYQITDPLQLRMGLARDKSPVPSANDRLSTLPDSDRTWLSVGAKWAATNDLAFDFAYTYIHIKKASANVNGYCGGTNPAALPAGAVNCVSSYTSGTVDFKSTAHLVGLQANYRF
ncbi:OmpP1/FadL family transporter [Chitinimonas sp. PSY-7]|uniref:outer membrane protein transport protein n=1 Tax=Chitinimonas sp. PSY-7 TaxID=3459088 RepID=UPI0040403AFC